MIRVLLIILSLMLLFPSIASACSCQYVPFHERIARASDITHVRVVDLEQKAEGLIAQILGIDVAEVQGDV